MPFLLFTRDVKTGRFIFKITPRRIPMTVCPTYKLIRGLVSTFDEDSDLTLTAEEKAILLTTVATNPDLAIQRLI